MVSLCCIYADNTQLFSQLPMKTEENLFIVELNERRVIIIQLFVAVYF